MSSSIIRAKNLESYSRSLKYFVLFKVNLIAVGHERQIPEGVVESLDNKSVVGAVVERGQIIVFELQQKT